MWPLLQVPLRRAVFRLSAISLWDNARTVIRLADYFIAIQQLFSGCMSRLAGPFSNVGDPQICSCRRRRRRTTSELVDRDSFGREVIVRFWSHHFVTICSKGAYWCLCGLVVWPTSWPQLLRSDNWQLICRLSHEPTHANLQNLPFLFPILKKLYTR